LDQSADAWEVLRRIAERVTEHVAGARARSHEPEQHRHRRRLAGTVRSDEPGDRAARDLDVEVIDDGPLAVPLGQAVHGERRPGGGGCCHASIVQMATPRVVGREVACGLRRWAYAGYARHPGRTSPASYAKTTSWARS